MRESCGEHGCRTHSDGPARRNVRLARQTTGNPRSADGSRRERFHRCLGVAAGGLRVLEFVMLDREEVSAKAFDRLPGRWTHIGRGDDGR